MATAPLFNFFDNTGTTQNLVVTTNTPSLIITGVVDVNTVDIQININGSGFVSDPTLVGFNFPNFTIPNLNSYPNGISLENGTNIIEIRAVDTSGSISPRSVARIELSTDVEMGLVATAPTGVVMNRYNNYVEITWSDENLFQATGFNVYASTQPGGQGSGYLRLNAQMIPATSPKSSTYIESSTKTVTYDFEQNDVDDKDLYVTYGTFSTSTGAPLEVLSRNNYSLLGAPKYRLTTTFSNLTLIKSYGFIHNRLAEYSEGTLNGATFGVIRPDVPIYYVVTAVFIDNSLNQMLESRYSIELVGGPLPLDVNVRGIRIRDQSQVVTDYIRVLQTVAPELSLIPGSTVREVHIEPFSNEIQKAYFLMDFVHRAKSFAALLAIDDPNRTGAPIPVANSQYKTNLKTALAVPDDQSVQSLIDNAFDSLARNFGINRLGRAQAVVIQTFYTTTQPTKDLYVQQNAVVRSGTDGAAPRFISRGQSVIPFVNASNFYNTTKKRWEIKVQMVAEVPGAAGNVPALTLNTVVNGASGFLTENEGAAFGGTDAQSNLELSEVAQRALVSLDTGTAGGYEKTVKAVPGVQSYLLVRSGDEYMMRDYDDVRKKHIGGKVDIYIKGTIERTIQQSFAFQFSVVKNMRFDVIDAVNLVFRAKDSRLSVNNPIQEMLYNPSQDLGLFNFSNFPTSSYDLTGVEYVDYRTIKLNTLLPQPTTMVDDFVEGDYRYRSNNKFYPGIQPVLNVSTVVGQVSGALNPGSGFTLYKTQDPLLEGESTISKNYVEINQVDNVPSGDVIIVNNETHVLIGLIEEPLASVGINALSVAVYSEDRSVLYNGPNAVDPDYLIVDGTQTSPLKIFRTTYSNIPNGSTVSVDYEHDENFAVTYNTNDVITRVQQSVDMMKHITADVISKQAIENPLNILATVQLRPGFDQATVDSDIRTAYSTLIDSKNVGDPVYVSDVVAAIDNVSGVNFIVQPFTRMTLADGALRVRDPIANDATFLPSISSGSNAVYILDEPLPFSTIDTGGTNDRPRGVYKDDLEMNFVLNILDVGTTANAAFIIGNKGAVIAGYSDDATLAPIFITPEAILAERLKLTANKVLVSMNFSATPQEVPSDHSFSATYQVFGDVGVKDILTSQVEYLGIGNLTLTFKQA
jgi:uncharacterized phage protein gp47/JayE